MIGMIKMYKKLRIGNLPGIMFCLIFSMFFLSKTLLFVSAFDFEESEFDYDLENYLGYYIINEEHIEERIQDYSININGEIAVAAGRYINIYDENGNYQYGYAMGSSDSCAINLTQSKIEIYRLRQRDLIRMDKNTGIISISAIKKSSVNEKELSKVSANMRSSITRIDGAEYKLNSTLTEVKKIDQSGNEIIIYSSKGLKNNLDIFYSIAIFIIVVVIVIVYIKSIKSKSEKAVDNSLVSENDLE